MKDLTKIKFIKNYLKVTSPLILSNVVGFLIPMTDTYMVSQLGNRYLAAAQLSNGVFLLLFTIVVGMSFGVTSDLAYNIANFRYRDAAKIFKHSIVLNICVAISLVIMAFVFSPVLKCLNGDIRVVELANPYFMTIVFSIIPASIHISLVRYLEAISRTRVILCANIVLCTSNVFFNYIFIYGKFGMPSMNLSGAGLGTLAARIFTVILFFIYCFNARGMLRYVLYLRTKIKYTKDNFLKIFKVGSTISLHNLLEGGFSFITVVMIGYLSIEEQAANALIEGIFRLVFSITWAFTTSSCLIMSQQKGKSDTIILKRMGNMCFMVSTAFICLVLCVVILLLRPILSLYAVDLYVVDVINKTKYIALIFAVCDCVYMVGLGLLRGLQDTFIPFITTSSINWIVGLFISYFFTFVVEMGIAGTWIGATCSYAIVAIFLAFRFYRKVLQCAV